MATATTATAYSTQAAYLDGLKAKVCTSWKVCTKHGLEFGRDCCKLRDELKSVGGGGTKGLGFSGYMESQDIPRGTYEYWMNSYEISIGVKAAKPAKAKTDIVELEPTVVEDLSTNVVTDVTADDADDVTDDDVTDADVMAALSDITDSPAFEPAAEPSLAVPLEPLSEVESFTTKLRKLFDGTTLLLKPSRVGDGLKSCTNKFNIFGLTQKQVEAVAKVI
jgi:hypothetical protein